MTADASTPARPALPALPVVVAKAARDPRAGLSGLDQPALEAWLGARGEPPFRARQILDAVWGGTATGTADVTTLPRALAAAVDEAFRWSTVADDTLVLADGGQTEKALHRLSDGHCG